MTTRYAILCDICNRRLEESTISEEHVRKQIKTYPYLGQITALGDFCPTHATTPDQYTTEPERLNI